MESKTFTVQQIYQERRQYRVPFYQRAYVWNLEDQWSRLWEDIREKADARLLGNVTAAHFMGAVVLEPQKKSGLIGVERHHIIDGQQRLTTLQYVLVALTHILREKKHQKLLPLVEACLLNPNPETMEEQSVEQFKLWPTFRDRRQYELAMKAQTIEVLQERFPESFTQQGHLRKIGVSHPPALEAILFFYGAMNDWIREVSDQSGVDSGMALTTAILTDISVVCISLGEEDDAQVIFETLNGHGAELHATDLIRNFIFMRAGSNADELYDNLWSQFEAPWWSELQSRGRLNRPRLEWFVQSAVQAQTGAEIDIGRLYVGYRQLVDGQSGLGAASDQLSMLNRYGEHYKAMITGTGDGPIAVYGRHVAAWDASPTHALAVRVAASKLPDAEQAEIFSCIDSYLVRRAVCGLTRKNYNKVFAQLLKQHSASTLTAVSLRSALASLTGDASRWPMDSEFRKEWTSGSSYPGRLDAAKLRNIFHRLETAMRSEKSEERVVLSLDALDIDHVMPQSWFQYWPLSDGSTATWDDAQSVGLLELGGAPAKDKDQSILRRIKSIPRLGNLTLAHYGVNRALQNRNFNAKRAAFFTHSNLQLNRALMQEDSWDEEAIYDRAAVLFDFAIRIWPR